MNFDVLRLLHNEKSFAEDYLNVIKMIETWAGSKVSLPIYTEHADRIKAKLDGHGIKSTVDKHDGRTRLTVYFTRT